MTSEKYLNSRERLDALKKQKEFGSWTLSIGEHLWISDPEGQVAKLKEAEKRRKGIIDCSKMYGDVRKHRGTYVHSSGAEVLEGKVVGTSERVVDYLGHELVESEYDALESMARGYFSKPAKDVFNEFNNYFKEIYLEIENKHLVRLDIVKQDFLEIPEEIKMLTYLQHLDLSGNEIIEIKGLDSLIQLQILGLLNNEISQLKGVDNLCQLRALYVGNNLIDYNISTNKSELDKLRHRGVHVNI